MNDIKTIQDRIRLLCEEIEANELENRLNELELQDLEARLDYLRSSSPNPTNEGTFV
ncbi:hypothetical protein KYK30_31335 [Shinella yambaruensis]|uniref:Uncharacterized protein n=1 Tax=Shinella yambaruensis TaxID=415996 RepID=A0ABQ5ZTV7_9HYPH|nr:hypothetical protein [Shinella yambaruensis]MCJ8029985.1 hypothetical protein [Shinella yambaruensis]MCU7984217.1 hypothetical protein [Shinella yambaruensis]GLR55186.1 hypothetical protein GCM10007923_64080 [Shinella yambaruensis]